MHTQAAETDRARSNCRLYGDGFQRSAGRTCVKQWRVHGHSERSATAAVKRSSGQTSIPSSVLEVTITEVHEDASSQPRQFADGAQASQLRRRESRLRLDFDGQEVTTPPEQEVDFSLTGLRGRPVRHLVEQIRIAIVGAQDRQDEAFEQGSALLGGDRTQLSLSGASQPRIDPIEFRVLPFSHSQLRLECRQARPLPACPGECRGIPRSSSARWRHRAPDPQY